MALADGSDDEEGSDATSSSFSLSPALIFEFCKLLIERDELLKETET
jgi:hypothetical protein